METTKRGFIVPLLLVIIAVLVVGGWFYIHKLNSRMTSLSSTEATSTANNSTDWYHFKQGSANYELNFPLNFSYSTGQLLVDHITNGGDRSEFSLRLPPADLSSSYLHQKYISASYSNNGTCSYNDQHHPNATIKNINGVPFKDYSFDVSTTTPSEFDGGHVYYEELWTTINNKCADINLTLRGDYSDDGVSSFANFSAQNETPIMYQIIQTFKFN